MNFSDIFSKGKTQIKFIVALPIISFYFFVDLQSNLLLMKK